MADEIEDMLEQARAKADQEPGQRPRSRGGFFPKPKNIRCKALLLTPWGLQTVAKLKIAKEAGLIRNREDCLRLAKNAEKFADLINFEVATRMTRAIGRCACKRVFKK